MSAAEVCSDVKPLDSGELLLTGNTSGGWLFKGDAGVRDCCGTFATDEGAVDTGVMLTLLRGCVLGVCGPLRFWYGDDTTGETDLFVGFRAMGEVPELVGVLTDLTFSCPPIAFRYD